VIARVDYWGSFDSICCDRHDGIVGFDRCWNSQIASFAAAAAAERRVGFDVGDERRLVLAPPANFNLLLTRRRRRTSTEKRLGIAVDGRVRWCTHLKSELMAVIMGFIRLAPTRSSRWCRRFRPFVQFGNLFGLTLAIGGLKV